MAFGESLLVIYRILKPRPQKRKKELYVKALITELADSMYDAFIELNDMLKRVKAPMHALTVHKEWDEDNFEVRLTLKAFSVPIDVDDEENVVPIRSKSEN